MSLPTRTDTRLVSEWWWTVDRWLVLAITGLMAVGAVLLLAAGPAAAQRLGLPSFSLVLYQLGHLGLAVVLLFTVSLLSPGAVRRLAVSGLGAGLMMLLLVPLIGVEINGAQRWLHIAGVSVQPVELVKPCLAVTAAWLLAVPGRTGTLPGAALSAGLVGLIAALLMLQPDLGQTLLLGGTWAVQLFVAGASWAVVGALAALGIAALVTAYLTMPYVAERVRGFLAPGDGPYQVERALTAFERGGLLGRGPGEGTVKTELPDAHADFILAVAGEELGGLACLLIIGLFAFVVLRGFARLAATSDLFIVLAGTGLLASFGLQAAINMASTLHLIPTKGMTLPLVSYGGSSLLAVSLGLGMLLALTRRRTGGEATP